MRDSFIFYSSFLEAIEELDDKIRLQVYDSITRYALKGEEQNLTGIAKALFTLIKPQLDANNKKLEEYNRNVENGKKGAAYGVLGGRPKKNNPPQKPPKNPPPVFSENPINANANVNANVNANANTNDKKEICVDNFDVIPIDPFLNPLIENCIDEYRLNCTDLCKLTGFERRDLKTRTRISEFLSAINCDMDYYRQLCLEANKLKYIANRQIDINSMVNNHIGIMNGKYVKQEEKTSSLQDKFVSEYEKLLEL